MNAFIPAPISVRTSVRPSGTYAVARVDGRWLGDAFKVFPQNAEFSQSRQWARAFLAACRVAPMVSGVRA
jgi:hypothetical protein